MDIKSLPAWLIIGLFILVSIIVIFVLIILFIALIKGREIKLWHLTISGRDKISDDKIKEKTKEQKIKQVENIEISNSFKNLGNIKTKMLPIYPVNNNFPLHYKNINFKYNVENIYENSKYQYLYKKTEEYVKNKKTIYNEATPNLLDYEITRNGERNEYFIDLEFGIQSYIDFLTLNRNIDTVIEKRKTIKEFLETENIDFNFLQNNLPKLVGLTSILVTSDNKLVFQKRKKSVIASNMFHVSIAEGLQIFPSYHDFLKLNNIQRQQSIVDKDIETAVYRGYNEELGLTKDEITELQLLSIYYDYELQQPIFQTLALTKLNSQQIYNYFVNAKGIDTIAEIGSIEFIKNELEDILLYMINTSINDKWSSHAIINIISYIESVFSNESRTIETVNKYFKKIKLYDLGKQNFLEKK